SHSREKSARFQVVLTAERTEVLLKLLHVILETGMPPVVVHADAGKADASPADFEQAVDVRKVVDQSLNSQKLRHLLAERGRIPRIVIIGEAVAELIQQIWADAVRVGKIDAACGTGLPILADGRQAARVLAAVLPIPGEAPKHKHLIGEAVISASHDVGAWIVRPRLLVAIVLVAQDGCVPEVGQGGRSGPGFSARPR